MDDGDSELMQLGVIISIWFLINKTVSRSMIVTGDRESRREQSGEWNWGGDKSAEGRGRQG